jgi:hypothetical protein
MAVVKDSLTTEIDTKEKSSNPVLRACLPPLDLQNSIILRTAIVINNEGGLGGD